MVKREFDSEYTAPPEATLGGMEIHAPEGPVHSFKDFLIHIAIVTLGILIAFGLEGLRETLHSRHLVRETREAMHEEMTADLGHMRFECGQVTHFANAAKLLSGAMPKLAQDDPTEVARRLALEHNPGYFIAANAWETALSTGVFAQIPTREVASYASAAQGIRKYTGLQDTVRPAETHLNAFVLAHPHPSAAEVQQEMELLLIFSSAESDLAFVCPQVTGRHRLRAQSEYPVRVAQGSQSDFDQQCGAWARQPAAC